MFMSRRACSSKNWCDSSSSRKRTPLACGSGEVAMARPPIARDASQDSSMRRLVTELPDALPDTGRTRYHPRVGPVQRRAAAPSRRTMMQTKAAVLWEPGKHGFEIEQLDMLEPRTGEVIVRYVAAGVCHSDLHYVQGRNFHPVPAVLGHEGAGIVEAVGPDVTMVKIGDHVLTSYLPSCGHCKWCTIGRPRMCDLTVQPRYLMHDGTTRFRKGNQEIFQMHQLGTFSERAVVPQISLIPIRKDAPLDVICLVSCGVMTGAGAVMNRAKIEPGATVAVWGCGGIGLNA